MKKVKIIILFNLPIWTDLEIFSNQFMVMGEFKSFWTDFSLKIEDCRELNSLLSLFYHYELIYYVFVNNLWS